MTYAPVWWMCAQVRWREGQYEKFYAPEINQSPIWGAARDADHDLELAFRQLTGVSRLSQEEVKRADGGEEVGTLIQYKSGWCVAVHHYGKAEIRILK